MGTTLNTGTSDSAAVEINFTDPCSGETKSIYIQVKDYTNYSIGEIGISADDYRAMIERDIQKDPIFAAKQLERMGLDGTQKGETSGNPLEDQRGQSNLKSIKGVRVN